MEVKERMRARDLTKTPYNKTHKETKTQWNNTQNNKATNEKQRGCGDDINWRLRRTPVYQISQAIAVVLCCPHSPLRTQEA